MKTTLSLFLTCLSLSVFAQKITSDKVPSNIRATFKQSFPEATKVKWIMEDKVNYEVEFKIHNQEQSVVYDSNGKWIESEIEIKASQLPESVMQTIKTQFKGYKIEEASQIEDTKYGKGFEVEIEKGERTMEVRFSATGEILNQKTEEENKGDKD